MRRLALILVAAGLLAAGCNSEGTVSPLPQTISGKLPSAPSLKGGDPAQGKQIFEAQGCANCHTFAAAHSKGQVGPDLDKTLAGKSPQFVQESIVNPNAQISPGFQPNVMPQTYGSQLSDKEIADLVAFLTQKQQ